MAVEPPEWLSEDAKREWKRLAPILKRGGRAQMGDNRSPDRPVDAQSLGPFAAYCSAVGALAVAEREIAKGGATFTTATGYVGQSPWVAIRVKSLKSILDYSRELGLTPA